MKPKKTKKLVLFGDRDYAGIAYEYFTHDSPYEVVGFTLNEAYITKKEWKGLPVVPFEKVEQHFPPATHALHVAVVYSELNRLRARVCVQAKQKGYTLASYVSSRAFVWHNAKIGEHAFIFEDNTIQPFVEIEENVILWSGNHIGHSSRIRKNCFLSSHVVVSGFCDIGENSFIGVNASIGNHLKLGRECWVGQGAVISKDVPEGSMVKTKASDIEKLDQEALMRYLKRISG